MIYAFSQHKLLLLPALLLALMLPGVLGAQDVQVSELPVFADPVEALGEVFILHGRVLDTLGEPVADATVEIWQTDSNGAYDHPNAPLAGFDEGFQHFGAAVSDAQGAWAFRTVLPGQEMNRPLHIHVRVRLDDEPVLTSQFYFAELLEDAERDPIFRNAGDAVGSLLLTLEAHELADGTALLAAQGTLVIDQGSGNLTPTLAQTEGPFYPVVSVSDYDNDLAVVSPQLPAFTLLNLDQAAGDDFRSIPDVGNRMVREFLEYRPYVSILRFRREVGKYVSADQVAAYEA